MKFIATIPLKHNGQKYRIGDTVEDKIDLADRFPDRFRAIEANAEAPPPKPIKRTRSAPVAAPEDADDGMDVSDIEVKGPSPEDLAKIADGAKPFELIPVEGGFDVVNVISGKTLNSSPLNEGEAWDLIEEQPNNKD